MAEAGEAALHAAFLQGGIATAAVKLPKSEPGHVDILAFSIGGTIAWEAVSRGMLIGHL